jgi:hypothetical protein
MGTLNIQEDQEIARPNSNPMAAVGMILGQQSMCVLLKCALYGTTDNSYFSPAKQFCKCLLIFNVKFLMTLMWVNI